MDKTPENILASTDGVVAAVAVTVTVVAVVAVVAVAFTGSTTEPSNAAADTTPESASATSKHSVGSVILMGIALTIVFLLAAFYKVFWSFVWPFVDDYVSYYNARAYPYTM